MPSEFRFEPRSPRYGPFSVLGLVDTNCSHFGPFLPIFGPFLGHIVELEGSKGLLVARQSRHTWSVATVSLCLSILIGYEGRFVPKNAVLVAQNVQFWVGTP